MQIVALDGAKLLALMLAGGIFALAGLWLMFRPHPAGEAARIELFGMKVQASSAGLLVFLIGAVFLAVPIFVPEKPAPISGSALPRSGAGATEAERPAGGLKNAEEQRAILFPEDTYVAEVEPNNRIGEANQIELGIFYSGSLSPTGSDFQDWFVLDTSELHDQEVEVQIRSLAGNTHCQAYVHDDREQQLDSWRMPANGSSNYRIVPIGSVDHIFVRHFLNNQFASCRYEFRVSRTPG